MEPSWDVGSAFIRLISAAQDFAHLTTFIPCCVPCHKPLFKVHFTLGWLKTNSLHELLLLRKTFFPHHFVLMCIISAFSFEFIDRFSMSAWGVPT